MKARPPARNVKGFFFIQQEEFYRHVWSYILQGTNVRSYTKNGTGAFSTILTCLTLFQIATSCDLSVYIVEYIKSLRENKVPVENIT